MVKEFMTFLGMEREESEDGSYGRNWEWNCCPWQGQKLRDFLKIGYERYRISFVNYKATKVPMRPKGADGPKILDSS